MESRGARLTRNWPSCRLSSDFSRQRWKLLHKRWLSLFCLGFQVPGCHIAMKWPRDTKLGLR